MELRRQDTASTPTTTPNHEQHKATRDLWKYKNKTVKCCRCSEKKGNLGLRTEKSFYGLYLRTVELSFTFLLGSNFSLKIITNIKIVQGALHPDSDSPIVNIFIPFAFWFALFTFFFIYSFIFHTHFFPKSLEVNYIHCSLLLLDTCVYFFRLGNFPINNHNTVTNL